MATMLIYPNQDVSLGHSTSGNNGYSVLRDTDDSSYIYQSVTTNDFVTLDSVFNFDSITLSNMVINSVNAIVRMQTTGSEGVNMAYMQVIGSNSHPKYVTDPTYNNFTNCSFSLTINDIGVSSNTIVASETHSNIQLTLETKVKKTTSSKPNFEIQISEFYIVIDYTSTETNNNNGEEDVITHELSKIKLNGIVYNIKDSISRNAAAPPLATETTDGLLSAADKRVIDGLNPNIVTTLSNLNTDQLQIINAKEENAVDITIAVEPTIAAQVRTDNLLDVHGEITPGFYISGTGALSNNVNDIVSDFIPVSPGDDIYYTGIIGPTTSASINRRLHVYKSDKTWIKQLNFAGSLHEGDHWSAHGVVPNNGAYVRVSWGVNDTHVMISVGAPQNYEPYYVTPFAASGSASFKVGATSDPEEATTYTYTVPTAAGNQYGFLYNPITGKLTQITGYIASYNGETLPGQWISDRDDPAEDETPSTGAEVVYWLDEEDYTEYDGTPITVPLNYHTNFFFIDNGKLQELKYYAETLAVDHLTVYNGMTFSGINVLGEDFQNLKNIDSLLSTKADIDSPALTGSPISTAPGRTDASRRIATAGFVQNLWNNVAPVEVTYKASRNYAVGDYVYILGTLYKVTVTVPQNGTLAVGTNVVATTVMDEMESQSDTFIIHTETTTAGQYYNQWTGSTDKTFNEITAAYNANKILILIDDDKIYSLKRISNNLITFEAVPNIQQTDSYYKSYAELYKDVSITYSTIRIDNSNVATRIKTPTTIVNHHPIIIEILDADGNTFKNGNDLTTLNANSITVGMEVGSWGNGSVSSGIFNPLTQVVVGDQTNFWNDGYATSSSEWYNLVKYTVEYEELPNSYYVFNKHIGTFKTLSERNGIPVIKTITIIYREDLGYYPFDEGDNLSQITATYSEVALSS